ncbi:MAG: serine/threonine protein kinase, partial [Planctomycetota bacterium]
YFAMELVRGRALNAYCEDKKLGTRQRLRLFAGVCDAVQYAHQKGVIHRDLKPDNILVDDFGDPKVLDFGVARTTDSDIRATTVQTDIGQLIGTVPYMSPEQVTGDPSALDTRSDVYSLGVVLYELLSGHLPHDLKNKNIPEAVRVIREDDHVPLSSISRVYRGDLDTIVSKALAKEKVQRYQTAAELVADVRRYVANEPIVARPASTLYQLRKFARRNKTLVAGVAAMVAVLIAGTAFSTTGFVQAKRQRVAALGESEKAVLVGDFLAEMLTSANRNYGKRDLTVVELLDEVAPTIDTRFAEHPDVAVQLHFTIGSAFWLLERFQEAEEHLRTAWEQGRAIEGEEFNKLDALARLKDIYQKTGRRDEAAELARDVLEGREELLGPTHSRTLRSMFSLAIALSRSGRGNRAEIDRLFQDAIRLTRETHGEDSEIAFDATRAWAHDLNNRLRFEDAEPHGQWLLNWCQRNPSDENREARAKVTMAETLGWLGQHDDALQLGRDACEIQGRLMGEGWWVFDCLWQEALNYQWTGRLEEAEGTLLRQLSAWEAMESTKARPYRHDFLLARLRFLGGSIGAAELLPYVDAYLTQTDRYSDCAVTARVLCLVRLGRYQDASAALDQFKRKLYKSIPPNHYERRLHLATLVELYEGLGDDDQAAAYGDELEHVGGWP